MKSGELILRRDLYICVSVALSSRTLAVFTYMSGMGFGILLAVKAGREGEVRKVRITQGVRS